MSHKNHSQPVNCHKELLRRKRKHHVYGAVMGSGVGYVLHIFTHVDLFAKGAELVLAAVVYFVLFGGVEVKD